MGDGFEMGQIQGAVAGESLKALTARYASFVQSGHRSTAQRQYSGIDFHDACLYQYNPMRAFGTLYSHACEECRYFKGQATTPLIDQYVDLAMKEFPDDAASRILWFQGEFTGPIVKAMMEAMYLSSTCLFSPFPTCFDADLAWVQDMEQMGAAINEVAETLSKAENRLGCDEVQQWFSYPCF